MIEQLKLGDVVYVWWLPAVIKHYGVVIRESFFGEEPIIRTVYPGQKTPVNETLSQFSKKRAIFLRTYPSNVSGWEVSQKAQSIIEFEYHLIKRNCEHFYKKAHGLPEVSEQVIAGSIIAAALGLCFFKGRATVST